MKKLIQTIILSVFCVMISAQTNEYMLIEQADGTIQRLDIKDIVKISFESDAISEFGVDPNFIPTSADIMGIWEGEYEGWDKNQREITQIKRKLILNPNGTYQNILQGKMGSGYKYVDFEREQGTYSYDKQRRMVVYDVKTDSLLDFRTHELVGYSKKHYFDHEAVSYTEDVHFTYLIDGYRKWVIQDNTLVMTDDKTTPVVYSMSRIEAKGTLDKPYTASEALAIAASLEANVPTDNYYYVKGYITEIKEVSVTYGNATYYIGDSKNAPNALYIYRGYYLDNAMFTSEDQIKVGDEVVLCTRLVNYRGTIAETYEKQCYIYSLNRGNDPVPDDLYNEPYTTWYASVNTVKEYMKDYTLISEELTENGEKLLTYGGLRHELMTSYLFNKNMQLVESMVVIFTTETTMENLDKHLQENYVYIDESDGTKMYMSLDTETTVFLSEYTEFGAYIISYYSSQYLLEDDNEEPTPTKTYFEEPFTQWDATPSEVKSEMTNRSYTIYEEGTSSAGLVYQSYMGKYEELASLYRFNANQKLAEIDIAFTKVTVTDLEEYVTTQLNYTYAGKGSDNEDVYATPDGRSYAFIYESILSDGSVISYISYIKRNSASARKDDATLSNVDSSLMKDDKTVNVRTMKLFNHHHTRQSKIKHNL